VVRRVDAQSGQITTITGLGRPGFSPDGTPAPDALLDTPWGLEVGPDGAIYVADSRNGRVRRLRPGGAIETIGGERALRLNEPHGLRLYGEGVLLISEHFANRVLAVLVPR
jgi:hypothetical protein